MTYESVDRLQNLLVQDVFHYAKDAKKAAGRALGTLVEIITFYLLKSWGFEHSVAIERSLSEYGNPEIKHNVEFSLHPILWQQSLPITELRLPLRSGRILEGIEVIRPEPAGFAESKRTLLTAGGLLRNSCVLGSGDTSQLVAMLESMKEGSWLKVMVVEQFSKPYAILECKRVGVEEGMRKGPQTIEKAKQGASTWPRRSHRFISYERPAANCGV